MDQLSSEDALRLNVLLASKPQAVRIDESRMVVYGLTPRGETKVALNPNCRDELYLKRVRELISGHVLGSPGGYPVYLRRWTRMGQARDESLEQLLMLGEPEAVVAVVHAQGLSDEQARRAWWALPTADNARRMLARDAVVRGTMGPVLADYLVEFLPFEEDPLAMIESVRLVLQPGLVTPERRQDLWARTRTKSAYLVGFLQALPDHLPEEAPARADFPAVAGPLGELARAGNPVAGLLLRVLDAPGQAYLKVCARAFRKPANQDVVNVLLDTIALYFAPAHPGAERDADLERVLADAAALVGGGASADGVGPSPALREVRERLPELAPDLRALLVLARLGYPVVRPVFSRTTAIGSLMRRKLEPVLAPLLAEFAVLQGEGR